MHPSTMMPTRSTYRTTCSMPQQERLELAVPVYPKASRSQRRRKRTKKRTKQQRRTHSSSSDEKKKRSQVIPTFGEPQVLLWHSQEERNTEDIFRHDRVRRRQEPDAAEEEPVDLLASPGPKWFEWDYWKERLSTRCCLPKQQQPRSSFRREPLIDYRPSYLGRYDDNLYPYYHSSSPWGVPQHQQQQHYYVMPWPPPQLSPLTDAQQSFRFSPHQQPVAPRTRTPEIPQPLTEDVVAPIDISRQPNKSGKRRNRHHRKNSSLLGTHYEVPQKKEKPLAPVMDAPSVSSLDESLPNWKTPVNTQQKLVLPDSNTTEGTSTYSKRINGLRRSHSRTASPRLSSKPPVPPPRRSSTGHKSQITNSTVASTALPPLPSPSTPVTPTGSGRDLARSFSEASANTNGSRHKRGGTVCEFSFESLSMNPNEHGKSFRRRSSSLPVEVQILQVHVPPEDERPPIRLVDSQDSWGVTPPKSYLLEEETPDSGYISPLEEEQFMATNSPGDRTNSPRERITSGDYLADVDSPQNSSSNPQDDDSGGDEENNDPLLFAKLKDPPSIPPGESWMLAWVNKDVIPKTPVAHTITNAVTPTQSPSSTNSSSEEEIDTLKQEYLPKNLALEQSWRSNHATTDTEGIALSGWVAFGLGDAIVKKLTVDGADLERSDVAHVVLPKGSDKLWSSKLDGTYVSIDLSGCRVEVNEISRQHGRAIYLKRNNGETVCTLLPICLPEGYNGDEAAFGDGSICFPKGDYLPDDQQYTTMHIMFALDAVLKSKQSFAY